MTSTEVDWERCAQRLAEGAWRWLGEVHETFRIDPDVSVGTLDIDRDLKPLGELALTGMLGLREGATGRHGSAVASRLVEFAWQQLRAGELLCELIQQNPPDVYAGETYAIFVEAGYHHPQLTAQLAHQHSLRVSSALDIAPSRALGVLNSDRVLGLPPRWDAAELTTRTLLGARPEPWALDLGSLYVITHIVYHLTNDGAHPGRLPEHLQDYLHDCLPIWIEVYLEAGHWDIVGELLMVDLCLSHPNPSASSWARLVAAQHENGMVPAEAWRNSQTEKNLVRNHYHSTAVAAMTGTLGVARHLDPHRQ